MTELSGYVFSALRRGEFTLYRGSGDGLDPILLVAPIAEYSSRESLKRLEHEHDLKAELNADWAVRPVALSRHDGRMALVLEDPGGEPLDQLLGQPMDVTEFLRLAIVIAAAVGQVHMRGLIHKNLKPANVLVDVASGGVWLTGFGIASRLPRERQAPAPPEVIAGTLAYMAPEQTGRMNRSIDARSDLYSLGVTFYEMLTGTLPFTASDPMEWVHCHIARQPPRPDERASGIPGPLAAIVMKLLAKTAEDRYQTAAGVEADLRRCQRELESHGRIDPFPLGAHDMSDQLLIPERLYGREREIASLLASFDRVVAGGTTELVLVSGYSGIGKSSVVNELHKQLVPARGLFAAGKFDQYKRDIPYATLAQAFQSLVRPLLAKSETELSGWRNALLETLGPNGRLMVDVVPELKLIIGEQPPVPELPSQDAQRRFQLMFRRFIGVFARPEHPLALFLDDLQWLDAATLDLLEDLLTHSDPQQLMLIGAYRDNEVTAAHPLMRKLDAIRTAGGRVEEITLAPLAHEHLGQLMADALRCGLESAAPLTQLVHEKTGGNPFFAIQFMSSLIDGGMLTFDHEAACWSWDSARIHAKGYTDNVVDLMVGKLDRLPAETGKALQQLACLGNTAEFETLSMVLETSEEQVHAALWPVVRQELIERLAGAYRFIHDRVQEAAYSMIPERLRGEAHLRIGRLLAAHIPPEKRDEAIFEIVNQLNRGAALITSREEREHLAELNLIAGRRAKASTAYASALKHLVAGAAQLGVDRWESRRTLTFALELERAECELLTGDLAVADERLTALSERMANAVERATVTCLHMDVCTALDQSGRAIAVALDYLAHVGIHWPPHPTEEEVRREYERIWTQLGSRTIEDLLELPPMIAPEPLATVEVLLKVFPAALFTDVNLASLAFCRAANLSLEHGSCDASPFAYVLLARIAGPRFGDYQTGFRFGQLGYKLVERRGLTRYYASTCFCFAVHVVLWSGHVRSCRPLLRDAFEAANRIGDQYAVYTCNMLNSDFLFAGSPLDDVQRETEYGLAFAQKARFGLVIDIISTQLALVQMLRGFTPEFGCLDSQNIQELRFEHHLSGNPALAIAECWYWIRKLQARCLAGDYAAAMDASSRAKPLLWTSTLVYEEAEYHFYTALCCAGLWDSATAGDRRRHMEALAAHYRQLEIWSENCPENFENQAALVGAEIARLEGRALDAMDLYERAIRSARANGFVHHEALANELAARFHAARGFETISHAYLRNARHGYLRWGADGKARQLDEMYPQLREEVSVPGPTATIGAPVEHLDLGTVIKVSQAVSSEIVLEKMLDTLMRTAIEQAGAERGLLILARGTEPPIAAEATTGGDAVTVRLCDQPVSAAMLPETVLHYVLRTHESVILDDAMAQPQFAADPYIRQRQARSILCLPLLNQARLIGVLYLENNLAPRVFAPARIAVLKLLASQAAISLENTRLYRDLAEREAKIRRLFDANIVGIFFWDFDGRILEANDAFLHMVGYDHEDLIAGRLRWTDLTPPDWHERDALWVEEHKRTGLRRPIEKEFFRKDGSRLPILLGAATFDEGGNQGVAFVLDLTDRKRAEVELRESEQNYRMLFESIDEGFCTIEVLFDQNEEPVDYRFLQINPSFERQTGIKNAVGRRMREIAPQHEEHWFEIYGRIALTGEPMRFENEAKQLGRWYDVYAFRVEDPKRRRVGILFNDITERKRAETEARESERRYREVQVELAHANRVDALGQLAASIAHEVSQPISAAVTNAEVGLRWLEAAPPNLEEAREALGSIVENGRRAGDVIGRIRTLIKKAPPSKGWLDINEAVRDVLVLARSEVLRHGVSLQTSFATGLPSVEGDLIQLQQVILNLIMNAIEAMSGIEGERELLVSTETDASGGVLLAVRDSGTGLDPQNVDRLFKAFYTTKSSGMGMGLSICRSIVEAHGGRVWASANKPRGAVFQFTLPSKPDQTVPT